MLSISWIYSEKAKVNIFAQTKYYCKGQRDFFGESEYILDGLKAKVKILVQTNCKCQSEYTDCESKSEHSCANKA